MFRGGTRDEGAAPWDRLVVPRLVEVTCEGRWIGKGSGEYRRLEDV